MWREVLITNSTRPLLLRCRARRRSRRSMGGEEKVDRGEREGQEEARQIEVCQAVPPRTEEEGGGSENGGHEGEVGVAVG